LRLLQTPSLVPARYDWLLDADVKAGRISALPGEVEHRQRRSRDVNSLRTGKLTGNLRIFATISAF
jgi:hypothetical protein